MGACHHGKVIPDDCPTCVTHQYALEPGDGRPGEASRGESPTEAATASGSMPLAKLLAIGTSGSAPDEADQWWHARPSAPAPLKVRALIAERRQGTAGSVDHAVASGVGLEQRMPPANSAAEELYAVITQEIRSWTPQALPLSSTDGFVPFLVVFSLLLAAFVGLVVHRTGLLWHRTAGVADRYPTAADGYRLALLEGCRGVALRGDVGAVAPLTLASFLHMACPNDVDYVTVLDALRKGRSPDRILVIRSDTVLFACNASIREGWYPGQRVVDIADGVTSAITVGPARMSFVAQDGVRRGWKGRVMAEALRLVG